MNQLKQAKSYVDDDVPPYLGHFSPGKYQLTPEQALWCERRLRFLQAQRPLSKFSWAQRVRGLIRSAKAGWVKNSRHGRSLLASRGGKAMRLHALNHVIKISRQPDRKASIQEPPIIFRKTVR